MGEARYGITSGTDVAYANSYWDGGSELSLAYGGIAGGADDASSSIDIYAYGYFHDGIGSDCATITFELQLDYSNTVSSSCPSSYSTTSGTYAVNSCAGGNGDNYYTGSSFGVSSLDYARYWRGIVSVSGDEASAEDTGCWQILDDTQCTLDNYWP